MVQGIERSPIGRSALGGAACGFTYDAAFLDAVARQDRLRRPLKLERWQEARRQAMAPTKPERELAEAGAGPVRSA